MSGSTPSPPQMAMPSPAYQYQAMPQADSGAISGIGGVGSMQPISQDIMSAYLPAFTGSTTGASGWNPGATVGVGNAVSAEAAPMFSSGQNMLNQFVNQDPTGIGTPAYTQAAHQTTEQIRAGEAARGVAMTPYGAGLEAEGMGKFNTNWQMNDANLQATAANAAKGLFGQGGSLATGGQTTAMAAPTTQLALATGAQSMPQNTANISQMTVQDFLAYLQGGTHATQAQNQGIGMLNDNLNSNFKNEMTAYNANNAMFSGLGSMAGRGIGGFNDMGGLSGMASLFAL